MSRVTRRNLIAVSAAVPAAMAARRIASAQEGTPVASPSADGYSSETLAFIDAILADVESGAMPGVVVYIDGPQGQLVESAGVADIASGEAIDPEAQFQIGSNTKMMTATMVLQLQDEGLLEVDGLLADYLPDVAAAFPAGDTITIRMLLNHTSGLYDVVEDMAAAIFTSWQQSSSTGPLTQYWAPEDGVRYGATYRASNAYFGPGDADQWHYTNTGYFILGMLIENLTGKTYRENLQVRILDPLGMASTYYSDQVWEGTTKGYYQPPFDFETSAWNLSQGGSAGAVVSTPSDLAVFMRALLGGTLFEDEMTLDEMKETISAPALLANYGLGLIDFDNGFWGHGGQTLGFNSKLFYNPDLDIVVVAWTNTAIPVSPSFTLLQFSLADLP